MTSLRTASTSDLSTAKLRELTQLLEAAFGESFTGYWGDIGPALHFMGLEGDAVLAHACVVERELQTQGHSLRTGYVEGVATWPHRQGQGHGTKVMQSVAAHILDAYELGALSTGRKRFYRNLGWVSWKGPTYIRHKDGRVARTARDDGSIMVLTTKATPPLNLRAPISAEWRRGELW
jgi:aminoglycoside 2'-N-acetyltransferase I